jgi:hypothetical protein
LFLQGLGNEIYQNSFHAGSAPYCLNNNNNNNTTDTTIPNNKPHIVIRDNKQGTCILIDIAVPGDRNLITKEAEKTLKYKDLIIEIQRMWNIRPEVIPVIIWATGTNAEPLTQYLSNVQGKPEIKELQTSVVGRVA